MKGYAKLAPSEAIVLASRAIDWIENKRSTLLEDAIKREISKPVKQNFFQWLFNKWPEKLSRADAINVLKSRQEFWWNEYESYTRAYQDTYKEMQQLINAAKVSEQDMLIDLETAAYLEKFKEKD